MSKDNYRQNPDTGLMDGSYPEGNNELQAKNAGEAPKNDKPKAVIHGDEFAIPDKFHGDFVKRFKEMFRLSREILAEHNRTFPDKDVAKYVGDDYWIGQASEYKGDDDAPTAKGELYGHDPNAVAINRIFSYNKDPKVRTNYVVVGDMGKDNGNIEIRKVNDTGMYASYTDDNGVKQKCPSPTNIVDFHKGSLDKFCGESNCGRRPIMMKTCETMAECKMVQKDMKETIEKWREKNVKK
ncbi:MAG: hypothetical protein HQK99_14640 [Nitrospirae bacterium]|nr:hypothetical protein [Nitrospirota bacterium]